MIELRQVTLDDVHEIVKIKDDYLTRKMSVGIATEITMNNQLEDIKRSLSSDEEDYQVVCCNDLPIGYIRINWMDENHAWLRFGLGCMRGKGYMKLALKLYLDQLFEDGLHRVDAEVYAYNERSYHLLKKLNYKHEGTKREGHYEAGVYSDVYVMGLLKKDWKRNLS